MPITQLTPDYSVSTQIDPEDVATIADIPQRLSGDLPDVFEIRGEVYMRPEDFEEINEERAADGKARLFLDPSKVTNELPEWLGDDVVVVGDEKKARELADLREGKAREQRLAQNQALRMDQ